MCCGAFAASVTVGVMTIKGVGDRPGVGVVISAGDTTVTAWARGMAVTGRSVLTVTRTASRNNTQHTTRLMLPFGINHKDGAARHIYTPDAPGRVLSHANRLNQCSVYAFDSPATDTLPARRQFNNLALLRLAQIEKTVCTGRQMCAIQTVGIIGEVKELTIP